MTKSSGSVYHVASDKGERADVNDEPGARFEPSGRGWARRAPVPGPVPASEVPLAPMPQSAPPLTNLRPPAYGQGVVLSVMVAAVVLVLAIIAPGDGAGLGVPMFATTTPVFWGIAILLIAGAGAFAQYVELITVRASFAGGFGPRQPSLPTAWAGPVVATTAAVLMVATYHNTAMLLVGPAIAFVGNAASLFGRDLLSDASEQTMRTAITVHAVILHVIAFVALAAIYLNKMSAFWSGPMVFVLSFVLFIEVMDAGDVAPQPRVFLSALASVLMVQVLLMLDWWPTFGWTGGGVLLVAFALLSMALSSHAQGVGPRSRDVALYGGIATVALLMLALTA